MLRDALRETIGVEFEKTPQSGGSHLKKGWKLAGDISTPDPDWPFCTEMKWREKWSLEGLWSKKCKLWEWWEQVRRDAELTDLIPVLVFKRNGIKPLVMIVAEGVLEVDDVMFFADPNGTPIAVMQLTKWLGIAKRAFDARKEGTR